jgi:hypothetical protein
MMRQSVSYLISALTLMNPVDGQPSTIYRDSTSDKIVEELNYKLARIGRSKIRKSGKKGDVGREF